MYEIVSEGVVVEYTDKPYYVTLESPNGTNQETDEKHADCVSVKGELYRLPNARHVNRDYPLATIRKSDGGATMFAVEQTGKNTEIQLEHVTAETEMAICEMDMMFNDYISEIEMTLCEMDMMYAQEGN